MDGTHIILTLLGMLAIGFVIGGFVALARILRKDEAIDAATFLALRQLEEYATSSKQPSGKPS